MYQALFHVERKTLCMNQKQFIGRSCLTLGRKSYFCHLYQQKRTSETHTKQIVSLDFNNSWWSPYKYKTTDMDKKIQFSKNLISTGTGHSYW